MTKIALLEAFDDFIEKVEPAWKKFNDIADDVTRGTFLEDERADPIVLGARIVEELELELGGRVVLTASRPDGEVTRALFHLTGVLETGTPSLDELLGDGDRRAHADGETDALRLLSVGAERTSNNRGVDADDLTT